MPRTKIVRKKRVQKSNEHSTAINQRLELVARREAETIKKLENERDAYLQHFEEYFKQVILKIPVTKLNKTVGELHRMTADSTVSVLCSSTNKSLRRSRSFATSDEGYHTTDSSNTTTGRQFRLKQKQNQMRSRSLSRTAKNMKTPADRQPLNNYGLITPKVGPNTPQVLLRRPKQGEVALSLQGSPLFTGSVVSETVANINIPLEDGRLLSIQPKSGLRMSQIPELDIETTRQLEALKNNLIKVCSFNMQK